MERVKFRRIEKCYGEVLRQLRTEKKLSQEELAFRANIDRTFVSMLERGLRMPSLATLLAVASALDTSGAEMVRQVEDKALATS